MSKVAVVTDSTAYIPEELCKKTNISVVALSVIWDGETFFDGVTINPTEFYTRVEGCENHADHLPGNPSGHAQDIFRPA